MKKTKLALLLELFICTFKIGAFTFGGGFAMIPIMEDEFVNKKKWLTAEEIIDVFAVVQSAPGVIAVNSCIYIGYKVAGFWGAIVATIGIVSPSFTIIALLSTVYMQFKENAIAMAALTGVRAGVVALILLAVVKLAKRSVKGYFGWTIATLSFLSVAVLKLNPIYIILTAALVGIVFENKASAKKKEGDQ